MISRKNLLCLPLLFVLAFSLSSLPFSHAVESASSPPFPTPPGPMSAVPPPPTAVGCYYYNNGTGWESAACTPAANVPPPPTEGGLYNIYGVSTTQSGVNVGYVWDSITTFTSEYDNICQSGAYSVQLNTNYFYPPNGHKDWVQFTLSNLPSPCTINGKYYNASNQACIWQFDLTAFPNNPISWCYTLPSVIGLSNTYRAQIEGQTVSGPNLQILVYVCTQGNCNYYSTSYIDNYGLTGRWTTSSGTILGYGGGSQAVFGRPVGVSNYVSIGAPTLTSASGWSGISSGESNNLNYNSATYAGCTGNLCTEDTTSN